uniref:Secreted protein n=1 Tax=Rhipicephalus appendiculatus TaxID=34631 RepID=A0A131YAK2_RHIAP
MFLCFQFLSCFSFAFPTYSVHKYSDSGCSLRPGNIFGTNERTKVKDSFNKRNVEPDFSQDRKKKTNARRNTIAGEGSVFQVP